MDQGIPATSGPGPGGAIAAERSNYWDENARIARINAALGTARTEASPIAAAIGPMLVALDWFGAPRSVAALLPRGNRPIALGDVEVLLSGIGFRGDRETARGGRADTAALPVGSLVLTRAGAARVYLGRPDGEDWWWSEGRVSPGIAVDSGDIILKILRDMDYQSIDAPQPHWFGTSMARLRGAFGGILAVGFAINLLALAVSLFTMSVYQLVIPSGITLTLGTLCLLAGLAVIGGWVLRLGRAGVLARLSGGVGVEAATTAFHKLLRQPYDQTSRAGLQANIARMRSAESVRQFLGGAGGLSLIDYPFVVIFLVVIGILGGWLVLVPLASLVVYGLLALPFSGAVQLRAARAGRANGRLNEEATSVVRRIRALSGVGGTEAWLRRFAETARQAAIANRDYAITIALAQSIGQALAPLTVLTTMAFGVTLILAGQMHAGGLIASMMLIWRVTTPAQQAFASLVRLRQLIDSHKQVDRLMLSAGEASSPQIASPVEPIAPALTVERLFYRYGPDHEPALNGVSFAMEPGTRLAVVGPNGAGKTTLLTSLAGLRQPQGGRILLGGHDIRQFDPTDYRGSVGYVAQAVRGLPLSIRDHFALAHPGITDAEIEAALERVTGPGWHRFLGQGDRRSALLDAVIDPMSDEPAAARWRFAVALASATVVPPMLLLLDDPELAMNRDLAQRLTAYLDGLRGRSTVVMATHNPELIQSADQIVILEAGNLVHAGPVSKDAPALTTGAPHAQ